MSDWLGLALGAIAASVAELAMGAAWLPLAGVVGRVGGRFLPVAGTPFGDGVGDGGAVGGTGAVSIDGAVDGGVASSRR